MFQNFLLIHQSLPIYGVNNSLVSRNSSQYPQRSFKFTLIIRSFVIQNILIHTLLHVVFQFNEAIFVT